MERSGEYKCANKKNRLQIFICRRLKYMILSLIWIQLGIFALLRDYLTIATSPQIRMNTGFFLIFLYLTQKTLLQ